MADDRVAKVLAQLDHRLDRLVMTPGGWGPEHAVELQYLQAVEIYKWLRDGDDHFEVNRVWSGVIHEAGLLGNLPVTAQTEGYDKLFELLPKLRARVLDG